MPPRAPMIRAALLAALVLLASPIPPNQADAQASRAASTLSRWARSHADDLVREGAESSSRRVDRLLSRHGDDLAPVLKEIGPKGARLLDDLPADAAPLFRKYGRDAALVFEHHGDHALRLARAHGDEAIEVLARHPGAGPRLLETFGDAGASNLSALTSESAIRLGKIADQVASLPPEARRTFLDRLSRGGDDFVTWAWKRRTELFGSASLAAGVLTLYKVGDGVAGAVPERIPRPAPPPDPVSQPLAAWLDRWGLPSLGIVAVSGLIALRLRDRPRDRKRSSKPRRGRRPSPRP